MILFESIFSNFVRYEAIEIIVIYNQNINPTYYKLSPNQKIHLLTIVNIVKR